MRLPAQSAELEGSPYVRVPPREQNHKMGWTEGASAVDHLLKHTKLERISTAGIGEATESLLERATKRLATATAAVAGEDFDGAFSRV
jgi:hypothetical protein